MVRHRIGHTLPAAQARSDELPRVRPIRRRAGRADGGATIAARSQQDAVRFTIGRVVTDDLTGVDVDAVTLTGKSDGAGAEASVGDLLPPSLVRRRGDPAYEVIAEAAGQFHPATSGRPTASSTSAASRWVPRCVSARRARVSRVGSSR